MVRPDEHLVSQLGILDLSLDADVASMLPPLRRQRGVVVAASAGGALLGRAGDLLAGDVIYAINQQAVANLSALRAALSTLSRGEAVVLQVEASRAVDVSGLQAGVGTPARSEASLVMTLPLS